MRGLFKFVLLVGTILVLELAVLVGSVYAIVRHFGFITVSVEETFPGGSRVTIPIPAVLVDGGLSAASLAASLADHCDDPSHESLAPILRAAAMDIENAPDFTLLDLKDRCDTVRITKRNNELLIHVEQPDARVEVRVPAHMLRRFANVVGHASHHGHVHAGITTDIECF